MDDTRAAQAQLGVQIDFLQASTLSDIDAAFAKVVELRASALAIGSYPLFISRPDEIAALATRYGVPAIHPLRAFAAAGGLMSYGSDFAEAHRLARRLRLAVSLRVRSQGICRCSNQPKSN